MDAVLSLQQEVAAVPELVGEPGPDDAARQRHARLDAGEHHGKMGIGEPGSVAVAALDHVGHALRLTERGLEGRRELPRAPPDGLGEAEPLEECEPAPLLLTVLRLTWVLGPERSIRDHAVGLRPAGGGPGPAR